MPARDHATAPATEAIDADVIIVGAGLSGAMMAMRLKRTAPAKRILLLESHKVDQYPQRTWSFHDSDIPVSIAPWLATFTHCVWARHSVKFPSFERRLESGYRSIRLRQLHEAAREMLGADFIFDSRVEQVSDRAVSLADGRTLRANECVFDARNHAAEGPAGWQKFLGLDLRLKHPHGLQGPVLMDATVAQKDGFRFIYLLPWSECELLVEDTRYSDSPQIDETAFRADILAYVNDQGWEVDATLGEERGSLAIPLDRGAQGAASALAIGVGAGLYHATTGYSLPNAICLAEQMAQRMTLDGSLDPHSAAATIADARRAQASPQRFYRLLNRMLFKAAEPSERRRVLERFYRMSDPLIARFYAGKTTFMDMVRILIGRPPVGVGKAMRCMREASVQGAF